MAESEPSGGDLTEVISNDGSRMLSRAQLRLLGIALVTLGASHVSTGVSAGLVIVGLVFALAGTFGQFPATNGSEVRWAAATALVMLIGILGPPIGTYPSSIAGIRPGLIVMGGMACVIAFGLGHRYTGRLVAVALVLGVSVVTTGALIAHEWNSAVGTDIYSAHRAAGEALAGGQNPYTDAVRFEDGNPYQEGRVFEGYPYPPVVVGTYGLAASITDPRLISSVAWLFFLGWLGWRALRRRSDEASGFSLAVLLVLGLSPLNSLVWFMAWTEPLTLAFFAVAAILWDRYPKSSGVFLGLALASKQYLVFLAPMLVLHRDRGSKARSIVAAGVAGLTILVGLAPDPPAFLRSTIGNLADIAFRPDTQSLPGLLAALGLEINLPNILWILVGLGVTTLLAKSSSTSSGFMIRAGLGLGTAFVLGMAFPNYWFLVAGLLAIGTVLEPSDTGVLHPVQGRHILDSSQGRRQETRIAGV
ncbi:MAG TPA: glycosyltransferase 87 family protein [Acidimicrobiia bacterium]|nr:glycosyltransferase 87 family protein [Acidimicrobiia bacterium]